MSEGEQRSGAVGGGRLAATVDGTALPEDEARALWAEFSRHMDEHRSDMGGFARQRGWFSVTPTHQDGRAVLVVQTKEGPAAAPPPPRTGGGGKKGKRRRR